MKLADLRKDYSLKSLEMHEVSSDPFQQFNQWMADALAAEVLEANAMCLATVGAEGFPNARIVLLKGLDQGFVFFTNYESAKGRELAAYPKASLTFFWAEIERQVRVIGTVAKITEEESDAYFLSRPYASQVGAWASPQSQEIDSRAHIEREQKNVEERFDSESMHRPAHWGGFRVMPHRIEFWQGRPSRLHDRIVYEKQADGNWTTVRLAP
jgi:pyridoxamine 5'-phosphate oxidase